MMPSALSSALSGLSAADDRMRVSASRIANLASASQTRAAPEAQGAGIRPDQEINLAGEIVEQQSAAYAYVANLKVLQTQLNTTGALLDVKA